LNDPNTIVVKEVHINNPYLDKFYGNRKKWASVMQMFMLRKRDENYSIGIKQMLETGKNLVFDRSVWSDEIFYYPNAKYMTDHQQKKYLNKRDEVLCKYSKFKPDIVEYLDVSPIICKNRIPVRVKNNPSLKCELDIPLKYLNELDGEYKPKWLNTMRRRGCNVVVTDWTYFGLNYPKSESVSENESEEEVEVDVTHPKVSPYFFNGLKSDYELLVEVK